MHIRIVESRRDVRIILTADGKEPEDGILDLLLSLDRLTSVEEVHQYKQDGFRNFCYTNRAIVLTFDSVEEIQQVVETTDLVDLRISQLDLPERIKGLCKHHKIRTIRDLLSIPREQIESWRGMGPKRMRQLETYLKDFAGLELGERA